MLRFVDYYAKSVLFEIGETCQAVKICLQSFPAHG